MRNRSVKSRKERGIKGVIQKAKEFLARASVFKADDIDINALTTSTAGLAIQQHICDTVLGPDQPAQVFSGRWVDKNNQDIAFYLAKRWYDAPVDGNVGLPAPHVFIIVSIYGL